MNYKFLLSIFIALAPLSHCFAGENSTPKSSKQEIQNCEQPIAHNEDIYLVSIAKKLYNRIPLDRYEKLYLITLGLISGSNALITVFGTTHGPLKERLALIGVAAGVGFIVGLPFASFNASEWYD